MAAEKCVICLIGAMDRLWYQQIILFSESEPSLFHDPENPKTAPFPAELPSKVSEISEREISPVASVITGSQEETTSHESDYKETTNELRRTRLNLVPTKTRFHSSSPISARKRIRNLGYSNFSAGRLQRTMSCKSLLELELEEVKGFTDLGFIFRKENLSKRMMRLIPGLRRLDSHNKNQEKEALARFEINSSNGEIEDKEKKGTIRPYLSEAWVVRRPDSPLINLKIPRVSTAEDMKKHLKYWARTVASAIQQEC
ncbi:hypothetical protein CDL12_30313 [Handroanthus impetiginosus]|uniref:Uncharacterized protein n=1 Tax=Handroanthus impetiginosus TaxID=429701 RepID=A0A2G9FX10_9LAMI|nr:hypothetical protein CDL12_30313 [Handroanthus impetiginosus]